jgi:hypothetical protein
MPSLRGHMVFMSVLRDTLETDFPELASSVEQHWPAALLGSEGPDAWYFSGQKRPDTHGLDLEDHTTWPDAMTRWLDQYPEITPGRRQPLDVQAFVTGYLSHLGLDTWEQYQHEDFPPERRRTSPEEWYPALLGTAERRKAALRALGEAPFPAERIVAAQVLEQTPVPPQFHPDAVRRVAAGIVPALPLSDPWEISRVNPLRQMPHTAEARTSWEQEQATLPPALPVELQALLDAAASFTLHAIRRWW